MARVRKTSFPEPRTTAALALHADREILSASKLILDTEKPAYRTVAAVRSNASGYWRTVTLPLPEAGIRLLPQNLLGMFASTMQTYRERLQKAARGLSNQCDTMTSEAERRLGTLFNASYLTTLDGLFDLEVTYPAIEPPAYLVSHHPEVYQHEQARVRERFEAAVELAEQAFAMELQTLTAHLAERLIGLHDGQTKVFRDSAVENLREFFERFRRLNIRSSPELDLPPFKQHHFQTERLGVEKTNEALIPRGKKVLTEQIISQASRGGERQDDGSCIRLRPTHRNHVWSYDFVADRTSDGRPIRMLTIVDELSRECLAIDVAKRLTSEDELERLSDLFVHRGVPEHIRS